MSILTPTSLSPEDVERLSERDGKHYELVDGELKEKVVGTEALLIAGQIADRFNRAYYPAQGFAVVEAMVYCFDLPNRGRKPDVSFVWNRRVPGGKAPKGDLMLAPDVVV